MYPNLSFLFSTPFGLGREDHNQIRKMEKGRYKEEGFPLPLPTPFPNALRGVEEGRNSNFKLSLNDYLPVIRHC